jgi:hypothetical protein
LESRCRCGSSRQVHWNDPPARRVVSSIDATELRHELLRERGHGSRTALLFARPRRDGRCMEARGGNAGGARHSALAGRRPRRSCASDWLSFYSVGQLATQLAELVQQQRLHELFIVGHSLGAYVGLALASGWFGIAVRGVRGRRARVRRHGSCAPGGANCPVAHHAEPSALHLRGRRSPR